MLVEMKWIVIIFSTSFFLMKHEVCKNQLEWRRGVGKCALHNSVADPSR
jgi:hypothetical protein